MRFKNKLVVGLMSAMLALTALACAGEDTTGGTDTGGGVEAPADGGAGGATSDAGGGAGGMAP